MIALPHADVVDAGPASRDVARGRFMGLGMFSPVEIVAVLLFYAFPLVLVIAIVWFIVRRTSRRGR